MATYAIGDVQGCFKPLVALLQKIDFDKNRDQLWFTGDLVNRGPESLAVLRFVHDLGDAAVTVLGNHDLHLLAVASGQARPKRRDTMEEIFSAADCESLLAWLRGRPLIHRDAQLGFTMVHAGLVPQWSLDTAQQRALEVESVLRSDNYTDFFARMYGNEPRRWKSELSGWERLRFITNVFTRIRYCDDNGTLDLNEKQAPASVVPPLKPWFEIENRKSTNETIIFGHWSTLGLYESNNVICLDSGCLWGGSMTAMRLDHPDNTTVQVLCPQQQPFD